MTALRALAFSLLVLAAPVTADAARLYIDPPEGTYGYGDTFIASVRIDSEDECINAAEVEVEYPIESLRAVDFSKGSSIFNLWVEEPRIDTERGLVVFAGGVPGGYCGRIRGDPAYSNVLGKIVFTVVDSAALKADVGISIASRVYLNDGSGTRADITSFGGTYTLVPEALTTENPWVKQVQEDDTPPNAFTVEVQSTKGVFGGRYYVVFATEDKQSGMDHFEILERGVWRTIKSPYNLRDQSLADIQVKAIDKAGNERLGDYTPGSAPERVRPVYLDYVPFAAVIIVFLVLVAGAWYMRRVHRQNETPPAPQV